MSKFSENYDNFSLKKQTFNKNYSTVFNATQEQAFISSKKPKTEYIPTNIQRNPTTTRNSSTFYSTVFKPLDNFSYRVNPYKPKDNISAGFFGSDSSEYKRKSIESDFKPNFQPNYKAVHVWKTDNFGNSIKPLPKTYKSELVFAENKKKQTFSGKNEDF